MARHLASNSVRHGRGQQKAVQARPGVLAAVVPRQGLPAGGAAGLPRPCSAGSMGEDREFFGKDEMAAAFASNGSAPIRRGSTSRSARRSTATGSALDPADLAQRIVPFLVRAGVVSEPLSDRQQATLADRAPRAGRAGPSLRQPACSDSCWSPRAPSLRDPADVASTLNDDARPVIDAAIGSLESVDEVARRADRAARASLIDGLGLQPQGGVRSRSCGGVGPPGLAAPVRGHWRSSGARRRWHGCGQTPVGGRLSRSRGGAALGPVGGRVESVSQRLYFLGSDRQPLGCGGN